MSELFLQLEPPPGGLRRMQSALDHRRVRSARPRLALACAIAVLVALLPVWQQWHARAVFDARLSAALADANRGEPAIIVENGAALLVADEPNIRIYWVATEPVE